MFLLSITGQIASASFEGNGASAGDTELYCKVPVIILFSNVLVFAVVFVVLPRTGNVSV